MKRDDVERLTLGRLSTELAEPVHLIEYVKAYNEERKRLARDAGNERGKIERRKGEIDRELNRASDAIMKRGVDPAALAPSMNRLKAERDEIDGKLAAIERAKTSSPSIRPPWSAIAGTSSNWRAFRRAPILRMSWASRCVGSCQW